MPKCVECGVEKPREEMFGIAEDLRCENCSQKRRRVYEARGAYVRPRPAVVSIVLCAVSALAYFAAKHQPVVMELLFEWPPAIASGQVWRILTSAIPHGGILHLVFNLYWVWMFGSAIETRVGWWRFLGLLLVLTAGANSLQYMLAGPAIGLSGTVYGLFGFLYALRKRKDFAAEQMQPHVIQLFVIWFVVCVVLTEMGVMRVGNVAHGAGAVFGWLAGQAVLQRWRYACLGALAILGFGLVLATPWVPLGQ